MRLVECRSHLRSQTLRWTLWDKADEARPLLNLHISVEPENCDFSDRCLSERVAKPSDKKLYPVIEKIEPLKIFPHFFQRYRKGWVQVPISILSSGKPFSVPPDLKVRTPNYPVRVTESFKYGAKIYGTTSPHASSTKSPGTRSRITVWAQYWNCRDG